MRSWKGRKRPGWEKQLDAKADFTLTQSASLTSSHRWSLEAPGCGSDSSVQIRNTWFLFPNVILMTFLTEVLGTNLTRPGLFLL